LTSIFFKGVGSTTNYSFGGGKSCRVDVVLYASDWLLVVVLFVIGGVDTHYVGTAFYQYGFTKCR